MASPSHWHVARSRNPAAELNLSNEALQPSRIAPSILQRGTRQKLHMRQALPAQVPGSTVRRIHSSFRMLISLPDRIWDLTSLQRLDLSDCTRLKSLPVSCRRLSNLEQLIMCKCGVADLSTMQLGQFATPSRADLHYCTSLGSFPDSFGCLHNLQMLDLDICILMTSLPNSFGNLSCLRVLKMRGCSGLTTLQGNFGNLAACESFP